MSILIYLRLLWTWSNEWAYFYGDVLTAALGVASLQKSLHATENEPKLELFGDPYRKCLRRPWK